MSEDASVNGMQGHLSSLGGARRAKECPAADIYCHILSILAMPLLLLLLLHSHICFLQFSYNSNAN